MTESKSKGLRLTLGGAPNVPHTIVGREGPIPGLYRPDEPVPVGGDGELSVESAKGLHDDKAVPLELVNITAKDVDRLRDLAEQDRLQAKQGAKVPPLGAADREKAAAQTTSIEGGE